MTERKPGRPKGSCSGKHQFMTEAEMTRFMAAAKKAGAEEWLMMACAFYYGLRVSELASMRWEQVDLVERKVTILRSKKGRDDRYNLTPELLRGLRGQLERRKELGWGGAWVFPARQADSGAHVSTETCKLVFKRIAAAAGITRKSIHSLRHTCAMERAMTGESAVELAGWLGQRFLSSVNSYVTAARRSKHEAAVASVVGRYLR